MAKFKEVLFGTEKSETEKHELQCYLNDKNEIFVLIEMDDSQDAFICFDKSTAIKFSKVLRREINKIREEDHNE